MLATIGTQNHETKMRNVTLCTSIVGLDNQERLTDARPSALEEPVHPHMGAAHLMVEVTS
jgi:hypothetical protein